MPVWLSRLSGGPASHRDLHCSHKASISAQGAWSRVRGSVLSSTLQLPAGGTAPHSQAQGSCRRAAKCGWLLVLPLRWILLGAPSVLPGKSENGTAGPCPVGSSGAGPAGILISLDLGFWSAAFWTAEAAGCWAAGQPAQVPASHPAQKLWMKPHGCGLSPLASALGNKAK